MDKVVRENLFNQAKQWVLEAGERIKKQMNDPLIIQTKSNPRDLVTTVDQETERFFATCIREKYPDHFLISEEGFGDTLTQMDGIVWIIDPIDGTTNFIHQQRNFAISLGIYQDGIGEVGIVYDVMAGTFYSAKRGEGAYKNDQKLSPLRQINHLNESVLGINNKWLVENRLVETNVMQDLIWNVRATRSYGSAALEFAYVAEGIIDGYLTIRLSPWDFAAGMVLVNEVGGITTNIYGGEVDLLHKNSILTCNQSIHEDLVKQYLEKGRK